MSSPNNLLSRLWLPVLSALAVTALLAANFNTWPGVPLRNNLMHLLPNLKDDAVLLQALERNNNAMSRKIVVLIGSPEKNRTIAATEDVVRNLATQDFFAKPLTGMTSEQANAIGRFYYGWRHVLLSEAQRRNIIKKNDDAFEKHLLQTVYNPLSGVNALVLTNDPLLTFYHFMRSLPSTDGKIQQEDGRLIVHGTDRDYQIIVVDITQDVFDMDFHPRYSAWRSQLESELHEKYPETRFLIAGAVEHAVWGASSAKQEVSTIGNGSLIGIILLIILVFPGRHPLLASLLPLGAGVMAGLVITLFCFGEIHLITLVFGSSVIGVAMDYSLHYMAEHFKTSTHEGTGRCMQRIFPGITMAMLTSVIAYGAIGFAPFPVLRQIAVFSCAGLVMAWLTVACFFPRILPPAQYKRAWYLDYSGRFDYALRHLFDKPVSKIFVVALALAMIPGVLRLDANDDMRLLQAPKASISAIEYEVQDLTGIKPSGRFLLIEGNTEDDMLQRCEALQDWLTSTQPHVKLDTLSNYVPSRKRQQENFELLKSLYMEHKNANIQSPYDHTETFAQRWQKNLGFSHEIIDNTATLFQKPPNEFISASNLLSPTPYDFPLLKTVERFQFAKTDRGYISTAFVSSNVDIPALQDYTKQNAGVHWMDPVSEISGLFRHYREQTGWVMLIAYSAIALLLCWRYRPAAALRVLIAPALAAWLTLGMLGYLGVAFNLFHVLALLLVLGVGIDFSIFFAESEEHRDTTMLAVILSTLTTLLSFGLLSLSETAAIRSFGIVVGCGIIFSLLFSPLAQFQHKAANQDKTQA